MKYTINFINKYIFVLILIISVHGCSNNDSITVYDTTKSVELLDVSYGKENLQNLDLYLPSNRSSETTKVLILVHGGSWVSGDKSELSSFVTSLKSTFPNYAIANLNYQLAGVGKSPFPMQLNDIEKAISHLKSNSASYEISDKIGFIGTSAGGHLSLLYSYNYDTSGTIEFVCSVVGPTNFTDTNYTENTDFQNIIQSIQLITGVPFQGNVDYYESISPYHVVNESAPPTILFYGGKDDLVPVSQGEDLHQKLTLLNIANEFTLYENEGHGWEGEALNDTYLKLEAFINTYF